MDRLNVMLPIAVAGVRDLESVKANQPHDYPAALEHRIQQLELERMQDKLALTTFTNVIACLLKVVVERDGGGPLKVELARGVVDFMEGAIVTVAEVPDSRDVLVQVRDRAPHPLWEGRNGQG